MTQNPLGPYRSEDPLPIVERYGVSVPPDAAPLRPQYGSMSQEWHETLANSQEVGGLLVAAILFDDPDDYADIVEEQGFDVYAEVAAISDYIALAHPGRPLAGLILGPPAGAVTAGSDGAGVLVEKGMQWLHLWVLAGAAQWTPGTTSTHLERASARLQERRGLDGIDLVRVQVQQAVPYICDLRTLYGWFEVWSCTMEASV